MLHVGKQHRPHRQPCQIAESSASRRSLGLANVESVLSIPTSCPDCRMRIAKQCCSPRVHHSVALPATEVAHRLQAAQQTLCLAEIVCQGWLHQHAGEPTTLIPATAFLPFVPVGAALACDVHLMYFNPDLSASTEKQNAESAPSTAPSPFLSPLKAAALVCSLTLPAQTRHAGSACCSFMCHQCCVPHHRDAHKVMFSYLVCIASFRIQTYDHQQLTSPFLRMPR